MPPQKSVPRLLTFKFTPEGLEKEAARRDGKMAVVGAELGSFKNIPASKDDFVLQAWAGESFVSSKVKDPIRIDNPCLSILLATQGTTSVNLLGSEALQEDGLVARFICLVPSDVLRMSFENPLTKAMNVENTEWLEHVVNKIYEAPMPPEGHLRLQIQEGSLQNWDIFSHQAFQQAENGVHPSVLQSWYRKLAGTALRFAGFLHLLKCIEGKRCFSEPVDQESVDGGLRLGSFYEQHAQVALDINANDNLKRAREALLILKQCGDFEISLREIYREKKWTKEQALSAVNLLEVSGMVACYKSGNSTRCLIHPGLKTSLFAY